MDIYGYCEQNNSVIRIGDSKDVAEGGVLLRDWIGGCAQSIGIIGENGADLHAAAICLGDFDGVHLGHARLFELAKSCGRWGVLLLGGHNSRAGVLTTLAEKLEIAEEYGADYVVIAEFSESFAAKSPREFAGLLSEVMKPDAVVVGYDYRFGYKARGDAAQLKELLAGKARVIVADAVTDGGEPVKSTKIRGLVKAGALADAAQLAGRPYRVRGKIVRGKQNGRKLGFPTANFDIAENKILPPDGVYGGKVGNRRAVINIGKNPTFGAEKRTFEVHVLDFDGDLYGKVLTAEVTEKIRGEIKFENTEDLKKQIENDVCAVRHGKE